MNNSNAKPVEKEKEKTQTEILIEIAKEADYICDELEQPYAVVRIDDHNELIKVGKGKYQDWLTMNYFLDKNKAPNSESLGQAISTMNAIAKFTGEKHTLQKRVAERDGNFYYDLCNKSWRIVKITPKECKVIRRKIPIFTRTTNMKPQVDPNFDGDIQLLRKHLRFAKESDWILGLAYIVSCLVPDIPHPVLVIAGEKGAAKSTTLRMLKAIIDPAVKDLLSMPNSIQDLALSISSNYMPCFDNLDKLSAEKSDLLCMASTGGGISKRMLYTNDEEVILSFKRCVGMNGINVVTTRADLLDRSLILELKRISEEDRKEESVIWDDFYKDLPDIIGGAMNALSKAMKIFPKIKLERLPRMADFTRWGYAIMEALGVGGEEFLTAYKRNQEYANDEAIESHPVAAAIVALMEKQRRWEGSVKEFLSELEHIAVEGKINTTSASWPKAPHALSRRMKEIKSNLEQRGIFFSIKPGGNAKIVTILKKQEVSKNKAIAKKKSSKTT